MHLTTLDCKMKNTTIHNFTIKEEIHCPKCGIKGIWGREQDYGDKGPFYCCTNCSHTFAIYLNGLFKFIHRADQELFNELREAEGKKEISLTIEENNIFEGIRL